MMSPRFLWPHAFGLGLSLILCFSFGAHAARRPSEIKQVQGYAIVPLLYYRDANLLMVEAKMNGRAITLLVDTGSPISIVPINRALHWEVTPAFAKSGPTKGKREFKINGERALLGQVKDFSVGPVHSANLVVAEMEIGSGELQHGELAGTHIDGLMGSSFLIEHGAVIDVQRHALFLPVNAQAKDIFPSALTRAGWTAVPFSTGATKLYVPARVEQTAAQFILDTGAPYTNLSARFAEQAGVRSDFVTFGGGVMFKEGLQEARAKVKELHVGSYSANGLELAVSPSFDRTGFSKTWRGMPLAGLLGVDFLGNHLAFIDYQSRTLFLKKP